MHNNFIVIGGYKILGYCTWKEDLKKSKHFNLMKGCAQSLNYFNAFLHYFPSEQKFGKFSGITKFQTVNSSEFIF